MQKRVAELEAVDSEPSWYLTRGGEQLGPLAGRELSLFAEGGNFKPGDLVWTAGFAEWKPADAVFGLTPAPEVEEQDPVEPGGDTADAVFSLPPSPEAETKQSLELDRDTAGPIFGVAASFDDPAHATPEPNGEDVDALIQALNGSAEPPRPTLKDRALQEVKKFTAIFVYLWVVFTVLLLHEWIVLSENHIGFKFYGLAAINALVLAKIMLVAEHFRFAEALKQKPLIYPIVYKTAAFTTLLFIAYILEETLVGWLGGHGFLASIPAIGGGLVGGLILWLIFCVALLPFFAFKELERVVGPAGFRKLLFG